MEATDGKAEVINNELIARFLRYNMKVKPYQRPINFRPDGSWYDYSFSFHDSWNWLMPVVEEIDKVSNGTEIYTTYCIIRANNNHTISSGIYESKLQAVYSAVVKFIEWYNQQPRRTA